MSALLGGSCLRLLWQRTPLMTSSCGNNWWRWWVMASSESSVEHRGFSLNDNSTKSVNVLRYCWNNTVTATASVTGSWDTALVMQWYCYITSFQASLTRSSDIGDNTMTVTASLSGSSNTAIKICVTTTTSLSKPWKFLHTVQKINHQYKIQKTENFFKSEDTGNTIKWQFK